jgi:hypothetical protein
LAGLADRVAFAAGPGENASLDQIQSFSVIYIATRILDIVAALHAILVIKRILTRQTAKFEALWAEERGDS